MPQWITLPSRGEDPLRSHGESATFPTRGWNLVIGTSSKTTPQLRLGRAGGELMRSSVPGLRAFTASVVRGWETRGTFWNHRQTSVSIVYPTNLLGFAQGRGSEQSNLRDLPRSRPPARVHVNSWTQ